MPTATFDVESIKNSIVGKLQRYYGITVPEATPQQLYRAVASTARDQIMDRWMVSRKKRHEQHGKRVYYLSVEFLMGRSLNSNLINLCSQNLYAKALDELGIQLSDVLPEEPEPALGNGGLGRLAACFMDSLASESLPAMGATIRYEYGLFRQKMVDGQQVELPDNWLANGNVWEIAATEDTCQIQFGGHVEQYEENGRECYRTVGAYTIDAVPYDMPIVGYNNECVNTLRTWSARSQQRIDLRSFGEGEYMKAMEEMQMAEVISKVLYPEDKHYEGKMLRLKQHYFFTSATLQYALKNFKKYYGNNFDLLPDKCVFHINDTHPGLAIPELIRLLIDQEGLDWDMACRITKRCMAYTNHTVMAEALECWPTDMMQQTLPRIYMILEELNRRLCADLFVSYPDQWERIGHMAIIGYGQVHMANLCVAMCFSVNGVSQLHGKILCDALFHDFYLLDKQKFSAITNGITHRRWLLEANPALTSLITEAIGDGFRTDAEQLTKLTPFADDAAFREKFDQVKKVNKQRLQKLVKDRQGIDIDTDFIFDTQAKRLHEYKRQFLNILHIMYLYNQMKEHPERVYYPRTFIFGGKAAAGYKRAKETIKLINSVAEVINNDRSINGKLKVVFIEDYRVSNAEILFAAADVSEQISTASKEASGTGNMKFMLNGAPTLGTMDGANVEIVHEVGEENAFIFGLSSQEVINYENNGGYNPTDVYFNDWEIKRVVDQLMDGTYSNGDHNMYINLYNSLLNTQCTDKADTYFILKDFRSYADAQKRVEEAYRDQQRWSKMAMMNTACSGKFTSDRTIEEYVRDIWHLEKVEVPSGQDLFE